MLLRFALTLLPALFACASLCGWAQADPKSLMVSPGDNSFFEIRDRPRELKIEIRRPDAKLRYKLEVVLNGRKVVDHFVKRNTFKVKLGRYDQDLSWRVQAYDEAGKLVLANEFATVKVFHNQRLRKIGLTVDRHSLKDKLIITWDEQEECAAYDVLYNEKKVSETKRFGVLLNEHADLRTVKIVCSDDASHYGLVELKPKKILSNSFYYEGQLASLSFKQTLDAPNIVEDESSQSKVMQIHALGWQLHWDKRKRNDLLAFVRYGRPVDFSDDLQLIGMDLRLRFDFDSRLKEKMLVEFETQTIRYNFNERFTAEQTMTFLGAGFETYGRVGTKVLKTAVVYKKELKTSGLKPSFKLRFHLPYTRKLAWTAEMDYSKFESELEASSITGEAQNTLFLIKAGLSYMF